MTGYPSKRAAARDKLLELAQAGLNMHSHDAPEYIVCEALIEALAQPAQEPVCPECKAGVLYECVACSSNNYPPKQAQEPAAVHQFRSPHCSDWYDGIPDHHDGHGPYEVRTRYTHPLPRPWVDLTKEEKQECVNQSIYHTAWSSDVDLDTLINLIQQKLKDKNNG